MFNCQSHCYGLFCSVRNFHLWSWTSFFVYLTLTRGAKLNLKAEEWFTELYGPLYQNYRQTNYRWEIIVLFRRLALVLILVSGDGFPYLQAILGGVVIVFCLGLQLLFRPYLSERLIILEAVSLSSVSSLSVMWLIIYWSCIHVRCSE